MNNKVFIVFACLCFYSLVGFSQSTDLKWWQRSARQNISGGKSSNSKSTKSKSSSKTSKTSSWTNTPEPSRTVKTTEKLDGPDIFEKYSSAVFMIFTATDSAIYQGSGFFINENGLAVTNYHLFDSDTRAAVVKLEGEDFYHSIRVIYANEKTDIILFVVDDITSNYIPIAASKPRVGDKVFAIGSPKGYENTFSSGEISQWRTSSLMQISNPIDHGSSGGALVNEYGEVVGITTGSFNAHSTANLNYALSIELVKACLTKTAYVLGSQHSTGSTASKGAKKDSAAQKSSGAKKTKEISKSKGVQNAKEEAKGRDVKKDAKTQETQSNQKVEKEEQKEKDEDVNVVF